MDTSSQCSEASGAPRCTFMIRRDLISFSKGDRNASSQVPHHRNPAESPHRPLSVRRAKLIASLEEQQLLLTVPNHVRTVQRWSGKGEQKTMVTKQQRVVPWWRTDAAGH